MFLGWITGMHPPGKVLSVVTAGRVVMHKLQVGCGVGVGVHMVSRVLRTVPHPPLALRRMTPYG
jgi:hypothetical protein